MKKSHLKMSTVWAVGPAGRVTAMPEWVWNDGYGFGREFQSGWRRASAEEIEQQENLKIIGKRKEEAKKVQKIQIVAGEDVQVDEPTKEFSYKEMKDMAREKGIKVFGKKKEVLAQELGLM